MIGAKQAAKFAMQVAADMLGQAHSNLEELERETYNGREVWSITLSLR